MKERLLAPVILSASLALGGCSVGHELSKPASIPSAQKGTESLSPAFQEKVIKVRSLVDTAQKLVTRARNSEGEKVLDYLRHEGYIADPISAESVPLSPSDAVISSGKGGKGLRIMLLDSDDLTNPAYKTYANFPSTGLYDPENNNLSLKEVETESLEGKAILFLHEGFHALDYFKHNFDYNYQDPAVRAEREVDAYLFQGELTKQLGGTTYSAYLDKVETFIRPASAEPKTVIPRIAEIYKHPEFGPTGIPAPLSTQELYDQTNFAGEYDELRILASGVNARARQIAFMQALYSYKAPAS